MAFYDVCELVTGARTKDEYGNVIINDVAREVFCEARSVYSSDYYAAAAVGLKPSVVLVLADYADYNGETRVRFRGTEYAIIRTFINANNGIELTCEKRGGNSGG